MNTKIKNANTKPVYFARIYNAGNLYSSIGNLYLDALKDTILTDTFKISFPKLWEDSISTLVKIENVNNITTTIAVDRLLIDESSMDFILKPYDSEFLKRYQEKLFNNR